MTQMCQDPIDILALEEDQNKMLRYIQMGKRCPDFEVNMRYLMGRTLFHICVINGFSDAVKELLKFDKIELNTKDDVLLTPLQYSMLLDKREIFEILSSDWRLKIHFLEPKKQIENSDNQEPHKIKGNNNNNNNNKTRVLLRKNTAYNRVKGYPVKGETVPKFFKMDFLIPTVPVLDSQKSKDFVKLEK